MSSSLSHFQLGAFSKKTTAYAERLKATIHNDATATSDLVSLDELDQALSALNLEDLSKQGPQINPHFKLPATAPKPQSHHTLTEIFYGNALPYGDFDAAIPGILRGVQSYIDQDKKLRTRGRLHGIRVNYSTKKTCIPYIAARLETARTGGGFVCSAEFDGSDPYDTCEWLLRPLVYWNRQNKLFADIEGLGTYGEPSKELMPQKERRSYAVYDDQSRLRWLPERDSLQEVFKGDWEEQSEEIVEYIMQKFCEHIRKIRGDGTCQERAKELVDEIDDECGLPRTGSMLVLTKKLLSCFERKDLDPEQYTELIEQQFYW